MKETIAHILEVVVVVTALFAVIAIITMMTYLGDEDASGQRDIDSAGVITQQIDETIENVFQKTANVISNTSTFSSNRGVGSSSDEDDDDDEL